MYRWLTPALIGAAFLVNSAGAGSVPFTGTWTGTLQNTALFEKLGAAAEQPYTYAGWDDVYQGQLTFAGGTPPGISVALTGKPSDPTPTAALTGRFGTPVVTPAGVNWDIFFFRPGQTQDVGVLHYTGALAAGTGGAPDSLTGTWTHEFLISDTNAVGLPAVFDVADGTFSFTRPAAAALVPLPPAAWAALGGLLPLWGVRWLRRRVSGGRC